MVLVPQTFLALLAYHRTNAYPVCQFPVPIRVMTSGPPIIPVQKYYTQNLPQVGLGLSMHPVSLLREKVKL